MPTPTTMTRQNRAKHKSDSLVLVDVGGKVWKVSIATFETMIRIAKDAMRKEGRHAIVAVGKGNLWTMTKTVFSDRTSLDQEVLSIHRQGMQVRFVRI